MDFYLPQNNAADDAANRAAPEETRITALTAQPYPDGYRLRVDMAITPFQIRPHIEVILLKADGDEVASTNIIEPLGWNLEFTMHIRGELNNPYTLSARLYYPDGPAKDLVIFVFDVTPPTESKTDTN